MEVRGLELPAGFRFHPTDEELVNYYLCRKCTALPIFVPIIKDLDLYKFDPWQLPEMALYGEKEWYFFTPRDRKYPNGSRPNRAAGTGYWKATGADKPIGNPKSLGIKKALVFYAGKAPKGIKTNWIMHEYRLANVDRSARKNNNSRLDDWVLCRIYNKKRIIEKKKNTVGQMNMNAECSEMEDNKPEIILSSSKSQSSFLNDQINVEMSDSITKLHTDLNSSDHVLSSEGTCDINVQSEPKWADFDLGNFSEGPSHFSEDSFGSEAQFQIDQLSPFQDMFMFSQNLFNNYPSIE